MDLLCDFVIDNIHICVDEKLVGEEYSNGELDDIQNCLFIIHSKINPSYIIVRNDYSCMERMAIYSFEYKNRQCEIYKIYGTKREYIGVRLLPIS
jgi:hypothetical protein